MTDKNTNSEALLEPLRIAIKLEEEGRKFFLDAAERIDTRHARQTFEFLADEETKHIERIKEFYNSIKETGGDRPIDVGESNAEDRLTEFNDRLAELKDAVPATDSDIEAYNLALKFENGAEEFYEKQLNEATNPMVKKFYRWLIKEEEMHSRLLKSCLDFAKDPAAWFERRGDSPI